MIIEACGVFQETPYDAKISDFSKPCLVSLKFGYKGLSLDG